MTQSSFLGCIAMAGALTVAAVAAQDGAGRQGGRGFGPPPSPLLMALDTDHDGSLSASEIAAAPASLKLLDRNGDGTIAADELPRFAGRGGRDGGRGGPDGSREGRGRGDEPGETRPTSNDDLVNALMAFDGNKDGKLTKAEVPERFQGLFARVDVDKDGQLTADELKRAAAAEPQAADATEGGRGEREGGRGERGGERGGPPRPMQDALLAPLDANGDGALSADEISGASAALRKLDRNADGVLSPDELPAPGRGRG